MTAVSIFFFFQAEDGIRDPLVTGVQTCALPISRSIGSKLSNCCAQPRKRRRCCWRLKARKKFRWKRSSRHSLSWTLPKSFEPPGSQRAPGKAPEWFLCVLGRLDFDLSFESMPAPITTIAEIGQHEGQPVTLRGWLYNLRESGKLLFPIFRDGSGMIQGIVPKAAVPAEVFDTIKNLTQESSVIVEGRVRADKRAPGGYELDVSNVQVVQRVPDDQPFPISL